MAGTARLREEEEADHRTQVQEAGNVGTRAAAAREDPQRHDRLGGLTFDQHERDEEHDVGADGCGGHRRVPARPETLSTAVEGVDAIVFTHGSTTSERDVRDNDYAGVANVLKALRGRDDRIALMTAIGTTRPGVAYAQWKLRSERLVRAGGNPYTIVRPGWFDYNQPDQRMVGCPL